VYTGRELSFAANQLNGRGFPDGEWYAVYWTGRAYWTRRRRRSRAPPDGWYTVGEPSWALARWTDTGGFSGQFVADLSPRLITALCGEKGQAYGQVEVRIAPLGR
jgi:hypothetical protein